MDAIRHERFDIAFDGIWIITPQGEVVLEPATFMGNTPPWSADRSQLVYAVDEQCDPAQKPGLFVMNRDGSRPRRLTAGADSAPCWQDSATVTFVRTYLRTDSIYQEVAHCDLMSVNLATQRTRTLLRVPYLIESPSWSQDGRLLAFTANPAPDRWSLQILAEGTSHPQNIAVPDNYCRHPQWARQADALLFCGSKNLYTVSRQGWRLRQLPLQNTTGERASFSPDATEVAFLKAVNRHEVALCIARAEGSATRQILPARGGFKRGFGLSW